MELNTERQEPAGNARGTLKGYDVPAVMLRLDNPVTAIILRIYADIMDEAGQPEAAAVGRRDAITADRYYAELLKRDNDLCDAAMRVRTGLSKAQEAKRAPIESVNLHIPLRTYTPGKGSRIRTQEGAEYGPGPVADYLSSPEGRAMLSDMQKPILGKAADNYMQTPEPEITHDEGVEYVGDIDDNENPVYETSVSELRIDLVVPSNMADQILGRGLRIGYDQGRAEDARKA